MKSKNYGKLTAWLIAAWFVFAFAASALHAFRNQSSLPSPLFLLAALGPIIVFFLWYASSGGFRQYALSLNPRTLTMAHSWRTVGFTFIALYVYGILPGLFALPAGWGDIAMGLTAGWAASRLANPDHRTSFIVWQTLGIADLVLALTLGGTAGLVSPEGPTMAPMTALPLSLIPTFGVPMLLILHVICIAQARRWPARTHAPMGQPVPSSAA